VSNHPRRYCGTNELRFITWGSYRSYAFGERVRYESIKWGEIKMKTPASAA
jgi:hypothetical protein